MISINLGKLESGESKKILSQLNALQAAGLQDMQLVIKGKQSRGFLNHLASEYDHKQASRQRMVSNLLAGSMSVVGFVIFGIVMWI